MELYLHQSGLPWSCEGQKVCLVIDRGLWTFRSADDGTVVCSVDHPEQLRGKVTVIPMHYWPTWAMDPELITDEGL